MTNIDWAKLVSQGRAKAFGVSWTEEEARAVYILKIPAEYVRKGILTLPDYEKTKGTLQIKTRAMLMEEAKELGIAATPEATNESLEKVIEDRKIVNAKNEASVNKLVEPEQPTEVKIEEPKEAEKPASKIVAKPASKRAVKAKK